MRPQTSHELGKRSLALLLCLVFAGNDVFAAIPAIVGHPSALTATFPSRRGSDEEAFSAQAVTPALLLRLHSLHEKLSIRIDGLLGKLVRHFAETPSAARPPQDQTATIFEREYMVAAPSPSLRYLHAAALGPRVALVIWDEKTHSGAVAQLHAEAGLKSALRDGVLYQLVRKMKSNPADLRVQIVGGNRSRKTDRLAAEIRKYLDANGIARVDDRHGQSGPDSVVLDLETGNLSPVDPGFIRDLPAEVIARPPIAMFSYHPPTPVDPRSRLNNYVVPLDPVNNIDRARQDRGRFLSAKLREKITIGKTRAPILQAHLEELVAKKRIDLGGLSIGELTQALLSTGEMLGKSPAEISPDDIRFIVQEYGDSDPTVSRKPWYVDLIRYPPGVLLNRWKRIFTGHILQMYVIIALGKTSHALGMDVFFGPFLADWWNKRMGKLDADHQALIRSTRSSIGLSDRDDTLLTLEALTRSEELSPAMRRVLRQMTMDNDVRVAEAAREALEHTSPMLSPEKDRLRTLDDDAPWPGEPGLPSVQVPETWLAPDADLLIPDKTLGYLFPFRPAAVPRTEALHRPPLLQAAPSRVDAFDAGPTTPFKYAPFLDLLAILNDLDLDLDLEPQIRAASTLEEIQRILKVDATTVKIFRAELIEKNARRMGTIYGSDSSSGDTPKAPASLAYWIVLAYTGDVGKAVRWGGRWLGGHPLERLAGLLGGAALAVFAPAFWWIPLGIGFLHVFPMLVVGWKQARAPLVEGRLSGIRIFARRAISALRFALRNLPVPLGIFFAYSAPALAMSFVRDSLLNLPIDHALLYAGVVAVSIGILWLVARYHARHDRRIFALSQQRQQVSPLGQTPLPLEWEDNGPPESEEVNWPVVHGGKVILSDFPMKQKGTALEGDLMVLDIPGLRWVYPTTTHRVGAGMTITKYDPVSRVGTISVIMLRDPMPLPPDIGVAWDPWRLSTVNQLTTGVHGIGLGKLLFNRACDRLVGRGATRLKLERVAGAVEGSRVSVSMLVLARRYGFTPVVDIVDVIRRYADRIEFSDIGTPHLIVYLKKAVEGIATGTARPGETQFLSIILTDAVGKPLIDEKAYDRSITVPEIITLVSAGRVLAGNVDYERSMVGKGSVPNPRISASKGTEPPLGQTPLPRLRLDWESLRRPFDPDDLDILSEPMVTHAGISLGIMAASLAMISWVILSFIDVTFRIHELLGIPRQPEYLATIWHVLVLSIIGVTVPVAEELLKNFFVLGMSHDWLKRNTGFSSRTVFLLSAFVVNSLWAVSHYFMGDQREAWKYFDVVAMGMMLIDGMIYSAAYWKTSNWSISAIAHCVRNGIVLVIMLATVISIPTPYKLAVMILLGPILWLLHNFLRPLIRAIPDRPAGLVRNQHRFPSRLKRGA